VSVLFTFYIQGVLKLKKNNSGAKRLMPETCWAHKKWNKIEIDIKLVFYSSTITMMHGIINIKLMVFDPISISDYQCPLIAQTLQQSYEVGAKE